MFELHNRTRRHVCLAAFFALAVAPTVATLGWCAWQNRPGHVQAEADRLGRVLGLDVALDGFTHPRPGVVAYDGLKLIDHETGCTIFSCRSLRATWDKTTGPLGHSVLLLSPLEPEVELSAFDHVATLLDRILRQHSGRPEVDVQLTADYLTLLDKESPQRLVEFQGSVQRLAEGTQAVAGFRLSESDGSDPVRIRLVRNRQTLPPSNGFELDTGGESIPCRMLGFWLKGLATLGSKATFQGYVWATQSPDADWDADVTGQLRDVDLRRLTADRLPHQLDGLGQLTIHVARVRQGRLQEASGMLVAGPGSISRSLIQAAVGRLQLTQGAVAKPPGELVSYEQLAVEFGLDASGIQLQGRCTATAPGAILVDQSGWLLAAPQTQPQPLVALLQTLDPSATPEVPATHQTAWLIRHLPFPQTVSAGSDTRRR